MNYNELVAQQKILESRIPLLMAGTTLWYDTFKELKDINKQLKHIDESLGRRYVNHYSRY